MARGLWRMACSWHGARAMCGQVTCCCPQEPMSSRCGAFRLPAAVGRAVSGRVMGYNCAATAHCTACAAGRRARTSARMPPQQQWLPQQHSLPLRHSLPQQHSLPPQRRIEVMLLLLPHDPPAHCCSALRLLLTAVRSGSMVATVSSRYSVPRMQEQVQWRPTANGLTLRLRMLPLV